MPVERWVSVARTFWIILEPERLWEKNNNIRFKKIKKIYL